MKCIYQTDKTAKSDDCFRACLASILEVPLEDIPDFSPEVGGPFWSLYARYLYYAFGKLMCRYDFTTPPPRKGYYIEVIVYSDSRAHCVVGIHGHAVHDPLGECTARYLAVLYRYYLVLEDA